MQWDDMTQEQQDAAEAEVVREQNKINKIERDCMPLHDFDCVAMNEGIEFEDRDTSLLALVALMHEQIQELKEKVNVLEQKT